MQQPTTRAARASAGNPHNMPVRVGNVLPKRDGEDVRAWLHRLRTAEHGDPDGLEAIVEEGTHEQP